MKKACLLISMIAALALSQRPVDPMLGRPSFENDLGFFPGETPPNTDVEVYLSLGYGGVQFVRKGDRFVAGFSVLLALYEGNRLSAKTERTDSAIVEHFSETNSPERIRPDAYILEDIKSGEYELKIVIIDRESGEKTMKEARITVPAFPEDGSPHFSTLLFLFGDPGMPCLDGFYPRSETLYFRLEALVPESLDYIVTGLVSGVDTIEADTVRPPATGGKIELGRGLPILERAGGLSLFGVAIRDGIKARSIEKAINISSGRYLKAARTPDEALEQLKLIGKRGEISRLKEALEENPEELDSLLSGFWREYDPTPNTETNELKEEFYRRVEIADGRFGGIYRGWKTDRGKTYIVHGEPDEIDRHPFDIDHKAYEIWYYYNPRRTFYFEDRYGDGTYILVRQE